MPTIYPDSIDLDVEDFIDDCSDREIEKLIAYLRETKRHLGSFIAPQYDSWNIEVDKLIDSKWRLSNEDEATILEITDKLL